MFVKNCVKQKNVEMFARLLIFREVIFFNCYLSQSFPKNNLYCELQGRGGGEKTDISILLFWETFWL